LQNVPVCGALLSNKSILLSFPPIVPLRILQNGNKG
jgi:hypothetical protein